MAKVGLALSGGGYRATAYHLGTLKKLHELGILNDISVISAVSGGSITAAAYGISCKDDFGEFYRCVEGGLQQSIIKELILDYRVFIPIIMLLISTLVLIFIPSILTLIFFVLLLFIFWKLEYKILPLSQVNSKTLDKIYFKHKKLPELGNCKKTILINATNIDTGRPFSFSNLKMSDSLYEFGKGLKQTNFIHDKFNISQAVSASICVPFAFSPVKINKQYFTNKNAQINPRLVDGGLYDNQGIHKLTEEKSYYNCDALIISDAGQDTSFEKPCNNAFSLLIRTSDILMNRIKNMLMVKHIYENKNNQLKPIAYYSLSWDIDSCISGFIQNLKNNNLLNSVIKAHGIDKLMTSIDIDEIQDKIDKCLNNCIPNFKDLPNKCKILDRIIELPDIDKLLKNQINQQIEENISNQLKTNVNFDKIKNQCPTKEDMQIARKISTNLTPLTKQEIDILSRHAACMTEIQVRLYCPELIKD
ncbi:MAG: patatin-like phospholipase family protein [Sphingobacteriaceae bacterium]|nr:patatin-like phospholipase family protein [Sphingobacteriaceae bacterium]